MGTMAKRSASDTTGDAMPNAGWKEIFDAISDGMTVLDGESRIVQRPPDVIVVEEGDSLALVRGRYPA